jgi:hypothetical protein
MRAHSSALAHAAAGYSGENHISIVRSISVKSATTYRVMTEAVAFIRGTALKGALAPLAEPSDHGTGVAAPSGVELSVAK